VGTHHTQNVLERGFGGVLQIVDHEVDERRDGVGPEYHVAHVLVRRQRLQRCRNLHTDPHTTPFVSHQCECCVRVRETPVKHLVLNHGWDGWACEHVDQRKDRAVLPERGVILLYQFKRR
jgi:hypothetical protein